MRYRERTSRGNLTQGCIGIEVSGSIEGAIKKFSRMTNGLLADYRKATSHYMKPSQLRHQKMQDIERKKKLALRPIKTKKRKRGRR